jgi:hypothetical protein
VKVFAPRQAVSNYSKNKPQSVWASHELDPSGVYQLIEPGMGASRVYGERPCMALKPKFTLPERPRIFASGSCFAREIELALHTQGHEVLSWNPDLGISNELFHRYTTHAIAADFQFALRGGYPESLAIELAPDQWCDFTGHGIARSREELLNWRYGVIDVHKQVVDADVVFVTLGLVEAWFDTVTRTYTNIPPWGQFFGSRYQCRITDYPENLAALERFLAFLRERVRPDLKVILTVSPVPLGETFSGQDIVMANAYSKSVLRAVAQDVAHKDPNTDYFPSYEMVTLADPDSAWLPDFRHVRREFVAHIISQFQQAYMPVVASTAKRAPA